MPFTAVVVDDEPLARDELKYLLSVYRECHVIGEAENAQEALELVTATRPDVVFLDIEMRGMSGCEAARQMLALPQPPLIIFATAYNEYAIQAFELGAIDYILKPFEPERLAKTIKRITSLKNAGEWMEAIRRLAKLLNNNGSHHEHGEKIIKKLAVEKNGNIRLIDYQDLIFGRASDGYVQVVTLAEKYTYNGTLSELEEKLRGEGFLRVHKSYLVNLNRVKGILPWFKGTYWLIMDDRQQTQIPVSKSMVKELKSLLGLN